MFWTHECTIIFRCIDIRYAAQTCCMKSKLLQSGWLCQLFSGFLVRISWYAAKTLKFYNCFVTYLRSNDWLDIDVAALIYCQHWSILENHFSGTPALLLAVICDKFWCRNSGKNHGVWRGSGWKRLENCILAVHQRILATYYLYLCIYGFDSKINGMGIVQNKKQLDQKKLPYVADLNRIVNHIKPPIFTTFHPLVDLLAFAFT